VADSSILGQNCFPDVGLSWGSGKRLSNARGAVERLADAVRAGWVRATSSDIGSRVAAGTATGDRPADAGRDPAARDAAGAALGRPEAGHRT